MTLRQAVCVARDRFASVDDLAPTAGRDAELLLLHTLSLPRTILYTSPGRLMNGREQAAFEAAVVRRLQREPVQYITGVQEFFGLPFTVTPAVLIPRPETELLVEAVSDRLPADRSVRIADVGTGSGAIAVALAARLPRAEVTAIDISAEALTVARQNAERNGVAERVSFVESDLFAGVSRGGFDAVVANPPYIPEAERPSLHPQVRDFEPAGALFGGESGLALYERLIPDALQQLLPGGLLAMELGAGQEASLRGLLRAWKAVQFLNDLQGIPRVVLCRRP